MSDPPRVLVCSFEALPGPTVLARRLTASVQALVEHFSVHVLATSPAHHTTTEDFLGARLVRVGVGSGDLAARVQAFERAVRWHLEREPAVEVAHFTDPFGGTPLCELREHRGHHLVYEALGLPSRELPAMDPVAAADPHFVSRLRRQELFCLLSAERVVTGSPLTRDALHALGVAAERLEVLPDPADAGTAAGEQRDAAQAHRRVLALYAELLGRPTAPAAAGAQPPGAARAQRRPTVPSTALPTLAPAPPPLPPSRPSAARATSVVSPAAAGAPPPRDEEPVEISADEALEIVEGGELLPAPAPGVRATAAVGARERPAPPAGLDPWLAQLAHGFCPPEGGQSGRPAPPTTFPGREAGQAPTSADAGVAPTAPPVGPSRTKGSA